MPTRVPSGREPRALAAEQTALRRVATLVAGGTPPEDVFAAVTAEVAQVLGVEYALLGRYELDQAVTFLAAFGPAHDVLPAGARLSLGGANITTLVFETGRPARIDDYADASGPPGVGARERGVRSSVGTPIKVDGSVWGVMIVGSSLAASLPPETETRLASFTDLVATAIANAESHARLGRLVEEQAALRRVATLVARGTPPKELFAAVVEEVGRVLRVDAAAMGRYDPERLMTTLAVWSATGDRPATTGQHRLGGQNTSTLVFETGRAARIDAYAGGSDSIAGNIRAVGVRSSVGMPIVVDGRVWGVIHAASTKEQPLPADTEARLASFTELVATALANTESRAGLARLVEEQAALRRIATLVASGSPQEKLFAAVAEEVGQLLGGSYLAGLACFGGDDTVTVMATWAADGEHALVPGPWPLDGGDLAAMIWRTGKAVRMDDYDGVPGQIAAFVRDELGIGSSVGSPIVVEGLLWGALFVHARQADEALSEDTESRLTGFAELVATAIANAESRAGIGRLVEEQAALRRIATLVARGTPPEDLFAAVNEEVVRLLPVDFAHMGRYEADGSVTVLAASGSTAEHFPVGLRWKLGGNNLTTIIFETGRPARIDHYGEAFGPLGDAGRTIGIRSSAGTPIVVEGRVWGIVTAGSTVEDRLPADLEPRLGSFTELMATAIANAESRAALTASRARIVAAADESRRRIERDLHDGAQQRLVHSVIVMKLALRALSDGKPEAGELVAEALRHAEQANSELRELAHGILPAALTRGGLRAGVEGLVSRVSLPVSVDVAVGRLAPGVEATAYFVISEALTNVVKHARASRAEVSARLDDGELRVEIRDDGVGGAGGAEGSGLGGLADRVAAVDGRLVVESPAGEGTRLCALLPARGSV